MVRLHLSLLYEDSSLTASEQYNVIEIIPMGNTQDFGRIEADDRRVSEGGEMIGKDRISKRISGKKKRMSVTKRADNLICELTLYTICNFDEFKGAKRSEVFKTPASSFSKIYLELFPKGIPAKNHCFALQSWTANSATCGGPWLSTGHRRKRALNRFPDIPDHHEDFDNKIRFITSTVPIATKR